MKLDIWHTTPFRLAWRFAAMFLLWGAMLVGVIYWRTTETMTESTDQIVLNELHRLMHFPEASLPVHVDEWVRSDHRHLNTYGLLDTDGRPLAGNMASIPDGLLLNGTVYDSRTLSRTDRMDVGLARVAGVRLSDGSALIVAREASFLLDIREIILGALLWGSVVALMLGLGGALIYGIGPVWRIAEIRTAAEKIQSGELKVRLPVAARGDELDLLATTVNNMLDEIERLLGEVKHVTDAIAHDLRTPMTRLRGHLNRLREAVEREHPEAPDTEITRDDWARRLDEAIGDTDVVLGRFRSLMRISEIENRLRTTDFEEVDLKEVVRQVYDLYEALAESKDIRLTVLMPSEPITVRGSGNLLFEAVGNLVDNAIKFTPQGGHVQVRLLRTNDSRGVEVQDSGPGIPPAERKHVLERFYRGRQDVEGSGLGLSITAAIARLHRCTLALDKSELGGLKATLTLAADDRTLPGHGAAS